MKVKISDRMTEVKIEKWMSGEVGVFNRSEVNCGINDKDYVLLKKREVIYNDMATIDYLFDMQW